MAMIYLILAVVVISVLSLGVVMVFMARKISLLDRMMREKGND